MREFLIEEKCNEILSGPYIQLVSNYVQKPSNKVRMKISIVDLLELTVVSQICEKVLYFLPLCVCAVDRRSSEGDKPTVTTSMQDTVTPYLALHTSIHI